LPGYADFLAVEEQGQGILDVMCAFGSNVAKTTSVLRLWPVLVRRYAAEVSSVIRLTSASITKGLVSTCMPASRWPLPTTAFSA